VYINKMTRTRASLLILGLAAFLVSADARVIDPVLKIIALDFGVGEEKAAWTISAYAFPYGLCQWFYGPLGDRIGKLKVMSVALMAFAIGTAACAFVPNLAVFIALRFITGVCAAAIIPLSLSYIGDKIAYEVRQVALARFMMALMLGQIFSSSLGGILQDLFGWRTTFLVFGGGAVLAAGALVYESIKFPEEAKDKPFSFKPFVDLFAMPAGQAIFAAVFIEGCVVFGTMAYLGAAIKTGFPLMKSTQIGLIMAMYGVGGLVYSSAVRKLVTRLGEGGIAQFGSLLIAAGCIVMSQLGQWWMAIGGIFFFGLGYFAMHGSLQTRATELKPELRATAVSLFAFMFFVGQAVGPIIFGQIKAASGYTAAFLVNCVVIAALGTVLNIYFKKTRKLPAKA
jgi:predicted MFS family arabinose efflux permease